MSNYLFILLLSVLFYIGTRAAALNKEVEYLKKKIEELENQ